VGLVLLAVYAGMRAHSVLASRMALRAFAQGGARAVPSSSPPAPVDFSLWSEKRIAAFKESLHLRSDAPLAVLRIPVIHLEVPVFEGADDWTLNRGVGRIAGTARPDEAGNIGIAGHRDGFFRGLKDVKLGDSIELATGKGSATYLVDSIQIVRPEDVQVLRARAEPTLTLATCYPFYYVGDAPQRYIIQAHLQPQLQGMVRKN
jgi:sortase A